MKKNRLRSLPLLSLLLLPGATALAQPVEEEELALIYGDKTTVSIATGSTQSLRRAPAVATVVTAEEIRAMGATNIDQVLESVPGIHVSVSADGYSPIYSIRGIMNPPTNPQVLMLQNGIPMTTTYSGDRGRYGSTIPVENIARIEVIRGPGAALYGADAYAGVINVITKTAADIRGSEFGVRYGSFDSQDAWFQHGGKLGAVDVAGFLRVGRTDGFKETVQADNATRLDKIFGNHASLAPGSVNLGEHDLDGSLDLALDKWRWRAGYKRRDHMGTGAGIAGSLDPNGENFSQRFNTDLSWNDAAITQDWGAGFSVAYLDYKEKADYFLLPPGARTPSAVVNNPAVAALLGVPAGTTVSGFFPDGMRGAPERSERQYRFSTYANYSGFNGHSLRFGFGHDNLDLYHTSTFKNYYLNAAGTPVPVGNIIDFGGIQPHITPHERHLNYLYAQDEWNFARDWALTAGVRYDKYSDFGDTTNPRLALVWDAALDLTTKLLYGRAYRAPSFNDQYGINPSASGNPNIRPETIDTLEAALAWQARRDTQVNLSVFTYRMQDIIRATANPAPAPGATFANSGSQRGHGVEVEVVWDPTSNLRISGNYAYQQSIDETTDADAGYAPHHHLYARADWSLPGGWLSSTQVNRVQDRRRAAGDTRPQVPDYTTVDFTLRTQRRAGQWDFAASIRNAFDAKVIEPSTLSNSLPYDLPMAPRSFWLQAIYKI